MSPWTVEDISDQRNTTALITGASSGIGLSSALALAARGARVLLACRKGAKATQAHAAIAAVACGSPPRLVELELADLASVARCAKEILNSENRIDLLMLNAGVMAMPRTRTADGFEAHFGINHLGHFALAGRLMPLVLAARLPRVVITSSLASWWGRIRWQDPNWTGRFYSASLAYGQSKLANLLFMSELGRRAQTLSTPTLTSAAAHPGAARTNLANQHNSALARVVYDVARRSATQSADRGALPLLYAATAPGVAEASYWGPDGPLELHGQPAPARKPQAARDPEAAARLWALSAHMTGVTWQDTFPDAVPPATPHDERTLP